MRADPEIRRLREENRSLRTGVELLHRVASLVQGPLGFTPVSYAVLTGVTAGVGLGLNRAMLFLVDEDRQRLRGLAAVGPASAEEADRIWKSIESAGPDLETLYEAGLSRTQNPGPLDVGVRSALIDSEGASPIALALRRRDVVIGEGSDDVGGLLHLPTGIAAPLRGRDRVAGVLYGDNRFTGRAPDDLLRMLFTMVADHAARALEKAQRFEEVARLARMDALTDLPHHGTLMADLHVAVGQALARSESIGFTMIDLDDFKQVNDTHGHPAGDALLAGVASRIRGVVRRGEQAYRYGGDEFAVILPGIGGEEAAQVGARIRDAVRAEPFPLGHARSVSVACSVGVASLPEDAASAAELVEAADRALRRAKSSGKDAVSHARSGP